MNTAVISAYFYFELVKGAGKTPKYRVIKMAGYYPPFETLKGVRGDGKGKITVFMLDAIDKTNGRSPETRLQAARSLNLTGLKRYWQDGKLSGYAYGNPPQGETYGNKKTLQNPFYPDYVADGFVFKFGDVVKCTLGSIEYILPECFEMLVIDKGGILAAAYCTQLKNGGFDGQLNELREQAKEL